MARHLFIGDDTAVSYASGVLADNAIDVQKRSASGWTSLQPGDTVADSAEIRIVQGNGTTNIVSPWFYGKDVLNWSGKSYVAAVAHRVDGTLTSNTAAISKVTTKIYRTDVDSHDSFSFETSNIASGQTPTQVQVIVLAAWDAIAAADKPDWLNDTAGVSSGDFRVTASKRGDTVNSGGTWAENNPIIRMIQTHSVDTQQTFADAVGVNMLPGYGDGFALKAYEDSLMGNQYGYYNRVHLPNTPASTIDTAETYDMYNIVASKDGSSSSQIHGVDNLIEITIAFDNDSATITQALEGVLNPYMNSAGFSSVNL
jgi:hypothetical protein